MLQTNLDHITTEAQFKELMEKEDNVMVCCGRMGPMCIPVYDAMSEIRDDYPHVAFRDLYFDGPVSHLIRSLPEVRSFSGLPFTVYFQKGKVVAATSSIQSKKQIKAIINDKFGVAADKAV